MTAPIKGPLDWIAVPAASHGFHVYIVDAAGRKIAALWGKEEEKVANGRLFSAAPQMLEALQQIHFYETVHDPNRGELFSGALHAVERAIDAATGEKPKPGGTR